MNDCCVSMPGWTRESRRPVALAVAPDWIECVRRKDQPWSAKTAAQSRAGQRFPVVEHSPALVGPAFFSLGQIMQIMASPDGCGLQGSIYTYPIRCLLPLLPP